MKIKHVSKIYNDGGVYSVNITLGKGDKAKTVRLNVLDEKKENVMKLPPEKQQEAANEWEIIRALLEKSKDEPVQDPGHFLFHKYWYFHSDVYLVEDSGGVDSEEIKMRIKHFAYLRNKQMQKISREVQAFENQEQVPNTQRERVSESVRLFVWQRDEGTCVKCGAKEKLEFDHIIPVAEGGSNTERNIQLLCESCNRSKGKNLA